MKLRFLALALAMVAMTAAAHAQIGIYVNPVVSRISNSTADTGPFAFLGSGQKAQIFGGVDFGAYYDFAHLSKADVGADVRDTLQHGNNASINSFLVGLRLASHPMSFGGIKPYAQLSVGAGRTRSPLNNAHIQRLQYGIFGGVDKSLAKHIDWRIIEVSYGSVSTINSAAFGGPVSGGPATVPSATVLGFSTGFVFRFK